MMVRFRTWHREAIMQRFLQRQENRIVGVLSGFDRILFRGTFRLISYLNGMIAFLSVRGVFYKDFGKFVEGISLKIRVHAEQFAQKHQRPFQYLESPAVSKEEIARGIMQRDHVTKGLVCVLYCVEPCQTFGLRKDREKKWLHLVPAQRKCLHFYYYFVDHEFGLMHVRLQSWLPMSMQVCLNGREYLARRLERAGISYEKRGNCFVRLDDLPRAQGMMDDLGRRNWPSFLRMLARRVNPWADRQSGLDLHGYYWTIRQSEYATDVMFSTAKALQEIYPALVNHAIEQFNCHDVLRFWGRRLSSKFRGQISSDLKDCSAGVRVKHWVDENSIKIYDKQGSVLRIETTINNPQRLKVRRLATRNGRPQLAWFHMRKGVADIARRIEVSRAANERYLEALGVVGEPSPTRHLIDPVSKRITRNGRSYRALRPIHPEEARLFSVLLGGEFLFQGFRNKDLRKRLLPGCESDPVARRRASGRITRLLRLLRAHKLIRKVSGTFYYRVTNKGNHVLTTALRLREIDVAMLAA
jgi:hypothetical protein